MPIWDEKTSNAVCPMASARPTSRIIGATTSARCRSSDEMSTALRMALAHATTPSCHVERKPLPPKFPPPGASMPLVDRSLRCSSTTLVRVIILCHSIRCSIVMEEWWAILLRQIATSVSSLAVRRSRCISAVLLGITSVECTELRLGLSRRSCRKSPSSLTYCLEKSWKDLPSKELGTLIPSQQEAAATRCPSCLSARNLSNSALAAEDCRGREKSTAPAGSHPAPHITGRSLWDISSGVDGRIGPTPAASLRPPSFLRTASADNSSGPSRLSLSQICTLRCLPWPLEERSRVALIRFPHCSHLLSRRGVSCLTLHVW